MTETEAALVQAGDALAGMFGCAVTAMDEGGEPFTAEEVAMGRSAILGWHRVRAIMGASEPPAVD